MALLVRLEQSRRDHGLPSADRTSVNFLTVGLRHERRRLRNRVLVARARRELSHPLGKGRERGEVNLLHSLLEVERLAMQTLARLLGYLLNVLLLRLFVSGRSLSKQMYRFRENSWLALRRIGSEM